MLCIVHVKLVPISVTIFVLILALGILSFKYKEQATKQANKCYQMFELFLEATKEETETD